MLKVKKINIAVKEKDLCCTFWYKLELSIPHFSIHNNKGIPITAMKNNTSDGPLENKQ